MFGFASFPFSLEQKDFFGYNLFVTRRNRERRRQVGFLSRLHKAQGNLSLARKIQPFDQARSRASWRETFKPTNKEDKPDQTGPKGRSIAGYEASVRYLLNALRSRSPGGWTDNRYEQSRHFFGIPYIAGHRGAEQFAQSEFRVYQKDPDHPEGKRPVAEDDDSPGGRLIHLLKCPNSEDTWGEICYAWSLQMDLTGMALTWVVPNALGEPIELYSIPTALAIPQPVTNPDFPHGYYRIQPLHPYGPFSTWPSPVSAAGAPIPAQWMMRMKFPHPLFRYDGYSPQTGMRLLIDEIESIDKSRWYAQQREIHPSAVLNFDADSEAQPLPEEEIMRIRAEMEADFQGPDNKGRLYVATPGAKLEAWGTSPKEMDYVTSWDQLAGSLFAGLGIPKPVAGVVDGSSYSQLFAALKQYHLLTLQPKLNRIAGVLTRFLAPMFGEDLIVELRTPRIDDHEVKSGKLRILIEAKAISKNELRQELELPVTKEEWGNEFAGEPSKDELAKTMAAKAGARGLIEEAKEEVKQDGEGETDNPVGGGVPGMEEPPDEIEQARPDTGELGKDALGPRMLGVGRESIRKALFKSIGLSGRNGKASLNGNSHRRF